MRALIVATDPARRPHVHRTRDALAAAALAAEVAYRPAELIRALAAASSVWLVQAGAWPAHHGPIVAPSPSATARPLVALGAVRALAGEAGSRDALAWTQILARTGGELDALDRPPTLASVYLDAAVAARVAAHLEQGSALETAIWAAARALRARRVRVAALDVHDDARLRVIHVVTSLQRGGAERLVIDLVSRLPAHGVAALLAVVGRPMRSAFAEPPDTIHLSGWRRDPDTLAARLAEVARHAGADLVHAHLLDAAEVAALARRGLRVVVTVHNARPGWPPGLATMAAGDATLLIACADAVLADVRAAGLPVPARTVWNAIEPSRFQRTEERVRAGRALRASLDIAEQDLVLLAVANPRPQKRLHLLPDIAREVAGLTGRRAHVMVAGAPSRAHEDARHAQEALVQAAQEAGVPLHLLGAVEDTAPVLAAADALVSTSAWEGLSLAMLEALAARLPVVATDVGGAAEIAGVVTLPAGAPAARFAQALAARQEPPPLAPDFALHAAIERHAHVYRRVVASSRAAPRGLLLVTNNFSTGGAQSSARRLLLALHAQGVPVRAAVIQEQRDWPTPGRQALVAAGVPVVVAPQAGISDAMDTIQAVLAAVDEAPPRAVLFWNLIAEHKVLLADALLGVPVFDVSPGEMLFASMDRYLARPRVGLPYRTAGAYGALLTGFVVKWAGEAERARHTFGAPVHVVPNGVELGPAPAPRAPRARLVIGTAARLAPQKRLEDLFEALRLALPRLPPCELLVAGAPERDGEAYVETLHALAAGLPVRFVGEPASMRAFLDGLDLFAMISEPAGCPNASLEAMAAGLPVVCTDVGGAREQVDHEVGWLVPARDAPALTEALLEAGRDAAARASRGVAARARVQERFSIPRMVAEYAALCGLVD
jgi:glycosyltransferase involved in cell wall biosynthesis